MTNEQLLAQLEELKAENLRLKASQASLLRFKVSDKGAISVYGLNARFPVTMYAGQWSKVFDAQESIKAFIQENANALASKA